MIRYLSLFSGIGGFEYGIQQSQYGNDAVCIGYSEIDKYADSIYRRRFPSETIGEITTHKPLGDATLIKTADLPSFELLVGGFPCQAFSVAGLQRGFDDTRGTLFFEIARILKDKRPKYFLLENVRNLLGHNKGETFKTILGVLSDLGYYVEWEILNSKDFVPQNRERIFIKGCLGEEGRQEILSLQRNGREINERRLKQVNNSHRRSMSDRVYSYDGCSKTLCGDGGGLNDKTGLYTIPKDFKKIDDNLYATTSKNGDAFALSTSIRRRPLHKKLDTYVGEITKVYASTQRDGKRKETDYSPCINASAGMGGGHIPMVEFEDFDIRRLTPVECERLQGFPDDWTKYGADGKLMSDTQRYRCCGNAVTTKVITHIFNNWDLNV